MRAAGGAEKNGVSEAYFAKTYFATFALAREAAFL
jgi:hypothetical protein